MNPLFHFSSSERRGILILLVLIILTILTPSIYKVSGTYKNEISDSIICEEIKIIQSTFIDSNILSNQNFRFSKQMHLKQFDPNKESFDSMIAMGINVKIAKTIVNYRNKGGIFHKKEDLKKLYGMYDSLYLQLEGFIIINDLSIYNQDNKNKFETYQTKTNKTIELNSADSVELLSLKGIGPVFASRIIKFRKKLGGFYNLAQINEVYGIDTSLLPILSKYIIVDTSHIQKLDINFATFSELNNHPYLEFEEVKAIFKYRKFKKMMVVVSELPKDNILSDKTYNKIKYYLK